MTITNEKQAPGSRPSPAPEEWTRRIAVLTNKIETVDGKPTIGQLDAPTAAERALFEERNRQLKISFAPASYREAALMLARFFAGFPALRFMDKDDAQRMLDVYLAALRDMPLWSLDDALRAASTGPVIRMHPPTFSEMGAFARAAVEPFAKESRDLDRILAARVTKADASPEARAEAFRRWQEEQRPSMTGFNAEQLAEERRLQEAARKRMIVASERHVATINRQAGIPKDHWPHSVHLRRKLVEMGAHFGGATGVGDVELHPGSDAGGGGGR